MNQTPRIQEVGGSRYDQAKARLLKEGIVFSSGLLAAFYETARADLRDWEALGDTVRANDCRIRLDELEDQDEEEYYKQYRDSIVRNNPAAHDDGSGFDKSYDQTETFPPLTEEQYRNLPF